MTGTLVGYARVSTADQNLDLQSDALSVAGCTRVFNDTASGSLADRLQLTACLDYVRDGDTLVVWRLDRLGRSLPHLIETVRSLADRGSAFVPSKKPSTRPRPAAASCSMSSLPSPGVPTKVGSCRSSAGSRHSLTDGFGGTESKWLAITRQLHPDVST